MRLPVEIESVMAGFEKHIAPLSEHQVADAILRKSREMNASKQQPAARPEVNWEWSAFRFAANPWDKETDWGIYFRPFAVGKTGDGQHWESPSIKDVSADTLIYWKERTTEANHPVLKARYADLVWEFAKPITSKVADASCARIAIDSYLQIISQKLYEKSIYGIHYAKRALELAITINDRDRIVSARDAIIFLEQTIRQLEYLGTWGFAFDLLMENKKVLLTKEQRQGLIDDMEKILKDETLVAENSETHDPFICEHAAMRLAGYYRRTSRIEEARRVLRLYAKVFLVAAKNNTMRVQAHGWVRRVYDVFHEYGMTAEAEDISVQLRALGQEARSEMQSFNHEVGIPMAKVEEFVNEMLEGALTNSLNRIAEYFIPDPQRAETQVKELAKIAPLLSMIRHVIVDSEGRDVAEVGSVEDDLSGRVIMQMAQNLQFESLFLRKTLEGAVTRHGLNTETLLDDLCQSPLFVAERRNILKKGLDAYFGGDCVGAVHLLVPQIEHALRKFLVLVGRPSFRPGRSGGMALRPLDDILRDPTVATVFGERVAIYLRVLLTDQRGWNLRNNLCHGILEPDAISMLLGDRVVHVLLILGGLRKKQEGSKSPEDGV